MRSSTGEASSAACLQQVMSYSGLLLSEPLKPLVRLSQRCCITCRVGLNGQLLLRPGTLIRPIKWYKSQTAIKVVVIHCNREI